MEADEIKKSSTLRLNSCDKNINQKFILQRGGKIQPKSNLNLCLTVSEDFREGGRRKSFAPNLCFKIREL